LYVGKRPYYPKGRIEKVGPPFIQQSFKGKDNFNPSTSNNPRFEPPGKKIQCLRCKKKGRGIKDYRVCLIKEKGK